jgi:hypothetical protein
VIYKEMILAGYQWLTTVILATQEAEIRRKAVLGQPEQIVHKTLSQKTNQPNKQTKKPITHAKRLVE